MKERFTFWEWVLLPVLGPIVFAGMLFMIALSRSVTKQADLKMNEDDDKENEPEETPAPSQPEDPPESSVYLSSDSPPGSILHPFATARK